MPQPWEMDWSSQKQSAPEQMPWEKDWSGQSDQSQQGDFLHPAKPAPGSGWLGALERIGQYPRIFLGELLDAGETLGKVSRGEIDVTNPEAIKAATTIAQVGGPAGEFAGTGGQIARRALSPGASNPAEVVPSAGLQAAQTAVDVGQPLPAGIVSETPAVKAFTQGFRQVPLVGPTITEGVQSTVRATGRKVGDIAEELGGGTVPDRATIGANTRTKLQEVIDKNNDEISDAYKDLRQNHIKSNMFASPANTKQALDEIKAKRWSAGKANVSSGLADVENLVTSGRSFDGMVRARSDIGAAIGANFRNPNPGFPTGDMKKVYAALSKDMRAAVTNPNNIRPTSNAADAMASFTNANNIAKDIINRNKNLQSLLNIKNDEGIVGSVINAARSKTGNARLLGELRNQMAPEDFEKIVSIGLNELGHTDQGFSLARFGRAWDDMSPSAKGILIRDPGHRKALDDISQLGSFLKDADKYRNTSNTAHAAGVTGALVALAEAFKEPDKIGPMLAGLAGGYGLSKILGRPASASALRKWLTIAKDKASGRYGPVKASAALGLATRNLQNNLPEPAQAEPARHEPLRVTVHPKVQSRAPSGNVYPPPLRP